MKQFTSKRQKIGELGEKIAEIYLKKIGFKIVEKNFTSRTGEIDIICIKNMELNFVEVKSFLFNSVSHETNKEYSASENLTKKKFLRIKKTALNYLANTNVSHETFEFILIVVGIDLKKRLGRIFLYEKF